MYRIALIFFCLLQTAHAQSPDSVLHELRIIDSTLPARDLISHRALNIFFSEAAGYYLSDPDNLTLYKNAVIANAAEGTLAIYHNLRQATGIDEPVHSFLSIGAQANIADAFTAHADNRPYNNQFGFLLKQTWTGRSTVSATPDQMRIMDTVRAAILHSCETAIRQRTGEFVSDPDLPLYFAFEYAHRQASYLARAFQYKVIAFHWTSVSLYLPLITENILVAPLPGDDPITRHAYPLHVNFTHTRLWEGSKFGRIYTTLAGDVLWNNSRDGYLLDKTGSSLYTGDYKNFITPAVKGQFIYFPTNSHIGVSLLLRQAFGEDHALNGILGIPVVLIDKQAEPAMNFEFQVRFYDMGHVIDAGKGLNGRMAIGLTAGIPFSKIAF